MIHQLILAVVAFLFVGSAWASGNDSPPVPVDHVNLERYVGLWYEIAKIPNRFQKQCVQGTTARYTIKEDGTIEVINRCVTKDESIDEAKGVAKIVDRESNAKLKVNFFRLLGLRLFWGDYWVIGLGNDYEYAIVGTPDRKYGWILSRTPTLEPEVLEAVFQELESQGYARDDFEMTLQTTETR